MEEIELIKNIKLLFKCGGLNLTKFLSNNKEVLETISDCDRKKKVTEQLTNHSSPTEAALGVLWDVEKDMCTFSVKLKEKPGTRRGMLSTLSSIFDPLSLVSLFMLKGKKILQQLCTQNVKWDEPVSKKVLEDSEKWKASVKQLSDVNIDRWFRKKDYKKIKHCHIHQFSDASETGYGVVTYFPSVNQQGEIFCNLVMARSKM